jgi:hypothetical protein
VFILPYKAFFFFWLLLGNGAALSVFRSFGRDFGQLTFDSVEGVEMKYLVLVIRYRRES